MKIPKLAVESRIKTNENKIKSTFSKTFIKRKFTFSKTLMYESYKEAPNRPSINIVGVKFQFLLKQFITLAFCQGRSVMMSARDMIYMIMSEQGLAN